MYGINIDIGIGIGVDVGVGVGVDVDIVSVHRDRHRHSCRSSDRGRQRVCRHGDRDGDREAACVCVCVCVVAHNRKIPKIERVRDFQKGFIRWLDRPHLLGGSERRDGFIVCAVTVRCRPHTQTELSDRHQSVESQSPSNTKTGTYHIS